MTLLADFLRYGVFVLAGVGTGFMLLTNLIAFKALRTPQRLGFLWWHITSISLSFICVGAVAMDNIVDRIGDPVTWRAPVLFVGMVLYAAAQTIIFSIERERLIHKRAQEILARDT